MRCVRATCRCGELGGGHLQGAGVSGVTEAAPVPRVGGSGGGGGHSCQPPHLQGVTPMVGFACRIFTLIKCYHLVTKVSEYTVTVTS